MANPASDITKQRSVQRKSLIIRVCENKKCQTRYEVTEAFQSHKFCPDCRPVPKCMHGIKHTERCVACHKKNGSWFIRS